MSLKKTHAIKDQVQGQYTIPAVKSNQAEVNECDILSRERSALLCYWLGITYVMTE